MRRSKGFVLAAVLAVVAATDVTTSADRERDLGREVLAPNDGWATVTNRAELIAALNNGVSTPTSPANPSNEPQIYAENNFFEIDKDIPLGSVIERLNGTAMFETGTLVDHTLGHDRGMPHGRDVSLLEEFNAVTDPDIVDASGTTWIPTLFLDVDRTKKLPNLVRKGVGPFGTFCESR